MSTFRRTLATAIAAAGLLVSTAAAANPAGKLSIAPAARASAPAGASKIGASVSTATLISIGVLVVFAAVVLATTGGDDKGSSSKSP